MNSSNYMICAHQTNLRTTIPDKKFNVAIFDNLDLRKYYVEIDGLRYCRESVLIKMKKMIISDNKKI